MTTDRRSHPGSGSGPQRYPGTFLLALREALADLGWQARRWLGEAVVCTDAGGEEHTVGLENLFRRARREDRATWPALIADFLTRARESEATVAAETDLAAVAERLLVRVGTPFKFEAKGLRVWSRPLAETGLGVRLVIDHADTMSYVTEEMVASSGRPGDAWVAQALANLRARTPTDCFQPVHEESGLLLCSLGDAYDASRALLVQDLLPEPPPLGCFVAVPSRDELLVLPVTTAALASVHLLKVLAERNYRSAPYPISAEVYWARAGDWHVFPIAIRNNEVSIRPPEAFFPVLEELQPGGPVEDIETWPPESEEG